MTVAEVKHVIADLAEALAYAHASGVVHRDLKPENIFWYQERALLADFGIARTLGAADTTRLTQTGMLIGTLDYISPEQAEGSTIDGRSDLYSLGCVAFELLRAGHLSMDAAPRPSLRRTSPGRSPMRDRCEPTFRRVSRSWCSA